jgi:hypothetical protein
VKTLDMGNAWEGSSTGHYTAVNLYSSFLTGSSDSGAARVACSVAIKHSLTIHAPVGGRREITPNTSE